MICILSYEKVKLAIIFMEQEMLTCKPYSLTSVQVYLFIFFSPQEGGMRDWCGQLKEL